MHAGGGRGNLRAQAAKCAEAKATMSEPKDPTTCDEKYFGLVVYAKAEVKQLYASACSQAKIKAVAFLRERIPQECRQYVIPMPACERVAC